MTIRQDIAGVAGNDLSFDFTLTAAGQVLNLDGYTLAVYLKPSEAYPGGSAAVFTTSSGLTVTDPAGGAFTWALPAAATAISAPGAMWYRVDVTDASSDTATAMHGALALTAA